MDTPLYQLSYFHFLTPVNNAVIHKFLCGHIFSTLLALYQGIELLITLCNILRSYQIVFHNSYIILQFYL